MKKKIKRLILTALVSSIGLTCCLSGCSTSTKAEKYFTEEEIAQAESYEYTAKGTVIAYGGGFDQSDSQRDIITGKAVEICGKENPKALFIPTGAGDVLSPVEPIIESLKRNGCEVKTLIPSTASHEEIVEKIAEADIIYELGGNLNFLTKVWGEHGVFAEMRKAYERGAVLMGVSTGAMCWAEMGYDNSSEEQVIRLDNDFPYIVKGAKFDYFNASGIIPFCICPHCDNFMYWCFDSAARKRQGPSIALDNGAALIYSAGKYSVFIDPSTPNRKVRLYYPERGINRLDITKDPSILNTIDGLRRANGYEPKTL